MAADPRARPALRSSDARLRRNPLLISEPRFAAFALFMNRILIIRGGAIGDFILTLPAIKLLRDRFPEAHIEILGSQQCAALAEKRFYADAIRSLESGRLARFFAQNSGLPSNLADYFAGFDLIVSYLFDPD